MPSFRLHLASLAIAALALPSCGKGKVGETVRPDAATAAEAMGESQATFDCTQVAPAAEPLIVDWPDQDRMDLALALQDKVAVVKYTCEGLKLVKHCTLPGQYRFAGAHLMSNVIELASEDAVQASLPVQGMKFSAKVRGASKIDIATAIIGRKGTLLTTPSRADLEGECDDATHFVRAAYVGAFRVATGTEGEARAAAEIFKASASADSTSTQAMLSTDGDFAACESYEAGSAVPPGSCQSAIRLEIFPIGDGSVSGGPEADKADDAAPPLENVCPAGTVPANGACAPKAEVKAYRCDPNDLEECKAQCELGDADSCYNAGRIITKPIAPGQPGSGADNYNKRKAEAFPLYAKACDARVSDACLFVASAHITGNGTSKDVAKGKALLSQTCGEMLNAKACANIGTNHAFGMHEYRKDPKLAEIMYGRACDLGNVGACGIQAEMHLEGKGIKKNPARGIEILEAVCDSKAPSPCQTLSKLYAEGKGVKKDKAKSEQYHVRACAHGLKSDSCRSKPPASK